MIYVAAYAYKVTLRKPGIKKRGDAEHPYKIVGIYSFLKL